MTITYVDDVEDSVWWQVAERCDYATFFNTPAWFHLAKELIGGSGSRIIGGKLANSTQFVLPIAVEKQIGPFYRMTSSLNGAYGGIIADGPITNAECQQIYQYVTDNWRVMTYTMSPSPLMPFSTELNKFAAVQDKTYIISLSQGYEKINRNYSRGHRSAINHAVKAGVVVEVTSDVDDYRAYYQVYLDSLNRWGDSFFGYTLPWPFFEKIHELSLQMPENVQLWVGRAGSEVISGAIILYWNKCVNYFHGANHHEYFSYRAANLVQNEVIKQAAQSEHQYSTYDFGPSGSENVLEFKRRFGGDAHLSQILLYTHLLFKAYDYVSSMLTI